MKKNTIISIAAILLIALITGGLILFKSEKSYFGYVGGSCKKISYTCPQYQVPFNDFLGCGCKALEDKTQDDPESRSLLKLVSNYVTQNIYEPSGNEITMADYLNLYTNPKNEEGIVKIEVWAMVRVYNLDEKNKKVTFKKEINAPVILNVQELGTNYIIRSHEIVDYKNPQQVAHLSESSQAFLASEDFETNKANIDTRLNESLEAQLVFLQEKLKSSKKESGDSK